MPIYKKYELLAPKMISVQVIGVYCVLYELQFVFVISEKEAD